MRAGVTGRFTFWLKTNEVPKIVMSRLPLRNIVVRLGFDCMNNVWKLDGILYEKDWYVIADYVPIAFFGVEFDCEATNIANSVLNTEIRCFWSLSRAYIDVNLQHYPSTPAQY